MENDSDIVEIDQEAIVVCLANSCINILQLAQYKDYFAA